MKPSQSQRLLEEKHLRSVYGLDEHQASRMLDHILGGCSRIEEERKHLVRSSKLNPLVYGLVTACVWLVLF